MRRRQAAWFSPSGATLLPGFGGGGGGGAAEEGLANMQVAAWQATKDGRFINVLDDVTMSLGGTHIKSGFEGRPGYACRAYDATINDHFRTQAQYLAEGLGPGTSDFSIAYWVRKWQANNNQYHFTTKASSAANQGWYVGTDSSDRFRCSFRDDVAGSTLTATGTSMPVDGTWQHIVWTFDRNDLATLYINGVAHGTTWDISTHQGTVDGGGQNMEIGASTVSGDVDTANVNLWHRVLDQQDVDTLYNGGFGIQHPYTDPSAQRINWDKRHGLSFDTLWHRLSSSQAVEILGDQGHLTAAGAAALPGAFLTYVGGELRGDGVLGFIDTANYGGAFEDEVLPAPYSGTRRIYHGGWFANSLTSREVREKLVAAYENDHLQFLRALPDNEIAALLGETPTSSSGGTLSIVVPTGRPLADATSDTKGFMTSVPTRFEMRAEADSWSYPSFGSADTLVNEQKTEPIAANWATSVNLTGQGTMGYHGGDRSFAGRLYFPRAGIGPNRWITATYDGSMGLTTRFAAFPAIEAGDVTSASLACHLDATVAASVLDSGGSPASNGENVATWVDQVTGLQFTQSTDSKRPDYVIGGTPGELQTSAANGASYLNFDGGDLLSYLGNFSDVAFGEVFIVLRTTNADDRHCPFMAGRTDDDLRYLQFRQNITDNTTGKWEIRQMDNDSETSQLTGDEFFEDLAVVSLRSTNTQHVIEVNGQEVARGSDGDWTGDVDSLNIWSVGAFKGATEQHFFTGQIYEIAVFNGSITSSERASLTQGLLNRYGVSAGPLTLTPWQDDYIDDWSNNLSSSWHAFVDAVDASSGVPKYIYLDIERIKGSTTYDAGEGGSVDNEGYATGALGFDKSIVSLSQSAGVVAAADTVVTGTVQAGTEDNTWTDNGSYHIIEEAGGVIDFHYRFYVGDDDSVSSVTWTGYVNATPTTDDLTVEVYNWATLAWDSLTGGTIIAKAATTDDSPKTMTGITANHFSDQRPEAGGSGEGQQNRARREVAIRFSGTGLTASAQIATDHIFLPSTSTIVTFGTTEMSGVDDAVPSSQAEHFYTFDSDVTGTTGLRGHKRVAFNHAGSSSPSTNNTFRVPSVPFVATGTGTCRGTFAAKQDSRWPNLDVNPELTVDITGPFSATDLANFTLESEAAGSWRESGAGDSAENQTDERHAIMTGMFRDHALHAQKFLDQRMLVHWPNIVAFAYRGNLSASGIHGGGTGTSAGGPIFSTLPNVFGNTTSGPMYAQPVWNSSKIATYNRATRQVLLATYAGEDAINWNVLSTQWSFLYGKECAHSFRHSVWFAPWDWDGSWTKNYYFEWYMRMLIFTDWTLIAWWSGDPTWLTQAGIDYLDWLFLEHEDFVAGNDVNGLVPTQPPLVWGRLWQDVAGDTGGAFNRLLITRPDKFSTHTESGAARVDGANPVISGSGLLSGAVTDEEVEEIVLRRDDLRTVDDVTTTVTSLTGRFYDFMADGGYQLVITGGTNAVAAVYTISSVTDMNTIVISSSPASGGALGGIGPPTNTWGTGYVRRPFQAADAGKDITIHTSYGNWVAGDYRIDSVSAGVATLSASASGGITAEDYGSWTLGTRLDLASDASDNTKVNSALYIFDANDIGKCLYITSGASWTPGIYKIHDVVSGDAFVDRSVGGTSLTAGRFRVGVFADWDGNVELAFDGRVQRTIHNATINLQSHGGVRVVQTSLAAARPTANTKLFMWLDANDAPTVLNAAGTTALVGEKVDTWRDIISSIDPHRTTIDFSNSTDADRPTLGEVSFSDNFADPANVRDSSNPVPGGRRYLQFTQDSASAGDSLMAAVKVFGATHTAGELFFVCRQDSTANSPAAISQNDASTNFETYFLVRFNGSTGELFTRNDGDTTDDHNWPGGGGLVDETYLFNVRSDGTTLAGGGDGVEIVPNVDAGIERWFGDVQGSTSPADQTVIGGFRKNNEASNIHFWDGRIYEIRAYDAELTITERMGIWAELQEKYGISNQ